MKTNGTIINFQSKKTKPLNEMGESERNLSEVDLFIWKKITHTSLCNTAAQIESLLLQWDQSSLKKNGNQEQIWSSFVTIMNHTDIIKEKLLLESIRLDKELSRLPKKPLKRKEVVEK